MSPSREAIQAKLVVDADQGRIDRFAARLVEDENGHLYDCDFREMVARTPMDKNALLEIETIRAAMIATKLLSSWFEDRMVESGLTYQQFKTLMWVRGAGEQGSELNQIANWLDVTPRNVTALVDGLEAQGLIERTADPTDRRVTRARITPLGDQKAQAAGRIHKESLHELMTSMTPEEKVQLRHTSLKLLRLADQLNEQRRTKRA